jgi:hypothetical protein
MQWWSWLLIWGALVIGLVGMLAYFAVTLFRKLMRAMDALGALGDQVGALDVTLSELQAAAPRPAIFDDKYELAYVIEADRYARSVRRHSRRDALVNRGKLLKTPTDKRMDHNAR